MYSFLKAFLVLMKQAYFVSSKAGRKMNLSLQPLISVIIFMSFIVSGDEKGNVRIVRQNFNDL